MAAVRRLNLGAGEDVRGGGWINHDIRKHRPEIDVVWDLNRLPWPWEDNFFDEIQAMAVLEHLELTLIEALDECWRILKPEGRLHIKYPVHTSPFIHWDPTHRWFWAPKTIDFVDPDTRLGKIYHYYTDRHWLILDKKTNERNCWVSLTPRGK